MKLADAITERLAKLIGEVPSSLEVEFYKNLIIALAGNSSLADVEIHRDDTAEMVIKTAETIIFKIKLDK